MGDSLKFKSSKYFRWYNAGGRRYWPQQFLFLLIVLAGNIMAIIFIFTSEIISWKLALAE